MRTIAQIRYPQIRSGVPAQDAQKVPLRPVYLFRPVDETPAYDVRVPGFFMLLGGRPNKAVTPPTPTFPLVAGGAGSGAATDSGNPTQADVSLIGDLRASGVAILQGGKPNRSVTPPTLRYVAIAAASDDWAVGVLNVVTQGVAELQGGQANAPVTPRSLRKVLLAAPPDESPQFNFVSQGMATLEGGQANASVTPRTLRQVLVAAPLDESPGALTAISQGQAIFQGGKPNQSVTPPTLRQVLTPSTPPDESPAFHLSFSGYAVAQGGKPNSSVTPPTLRSPLVVPAEDTFSSQKWPPVVVQQGAASGTLILPKPPQAVRATPAPTDPFLYERTFVWQTPQQVLAAKLPPSPPGVLFFDQFIDYDNTALGKHKPNTGSGWTQFGGIAAAQIVSGRVQFTTSFSTATGFYADATRSDYDFYADVTNTQATNWPAVMVRLNPADGSGFYLFFGDDVAGSVTLAEYDGASFTVRGGPWHTTYANGTAQVHINCTGGTLTVYINGQLMGNYAGATRNQTTTTFGIGAWDQASNPTAFFDNVAAVALTQRYLFANLNNAAQMGGCYVFPTFLGDGDSQQFLNFLGSLDGINWVCIPAVYNPPSGICRDCSYRYDGGRHWLAHIRDGVSSGVAQPSSAFGVATCIDGVNWTKLLDVDCSSVTGVGSGARTWSPEWQQDATAPQGQRIVVALTSTGGSDTGFQICETHPTTSDFLTWTAPAALTGSGLTNNLIDPNPKIVGTTAYVFEKDENAKFVVVMSAPLSGGGWPTSGWTMLYTGDWMGVGSGLEGPELVVRPDNQTWLYVDNYQAATGVHYTVEEAGDWTTGGSTAWSGLNPISVPYSVVARHGSVTYLGGIPPEGPRLTWVAAPVDESSILLAGTSQGYALQQGGRPNRSATPPTLRSVAFVSPDLSALYDKTAAGSGNVTQLRLTVVAPTAPRPVLQAQVADTLSLEPWPPTRLLGGKPSKSVTPPTLRTVLQASFVEDTFSSQRHAEGLVLGGRPSKAVTPPTLRVPLVAQTEDVYSRLALPTYFAQLVIMNAVPVPVFVVGNPLRFVGFDPGRLFDGTNPGRLFDGEPPARTFIGPGDF